MTFFKRRDHREGPSAGAGPARRTSTRDHRIGSGGNPLEESLRRSQVANTQVRGLEDDLFDQIMSGSDLALDQLREGGQRAVNQQLALGVSGAPGQGGLAQRLASQNSSRIQNDIRQQADILRAESQLGARQSLADLLARARAQDLLQFQGANQIGTFRDAVIKGATDAAGQVLTSGGGGGGGSRPHVGPPGAPQSLRAAPGTPNLAQLMSVGLQDGRAAQGQQLPGRLTGFSEDERFDRLRGLI